MKNVEYVVPLCKCSLMRAFFTSMLALLAATFHAGAQEKFLLFESYQNDTIPYRIPAMAELWDGSVYALADFR